MVFFAKLTDLSDTNASLVMNRVGRMAQIKKKKDVVDLFRGERFHDVDGQKNVVICSCLHMVQVLNMSHDLHAKFQVT